MPGSCLQEAKKFTRHGCRRRLQCADINHALQVRDIEQMYGFSSTDRRRYSQIAGAPDTFQVKDTLHRCEDVINRDLPRAPADLGMRMHWFLVKGVKPRIPENAVPQKLIQWHQDKVRQKRMRARRCRRPAQRMHVRQAMPSTGTAHACAPGDAVDRHSACMPTAQQHPAGGWVACRQWQQQQRL
jgi:hypothetical protein